MNINSISLDTLVRGLNAKRSGGSWMAVCPAHDDRNPSLAIRESNGKILVHCHAGCNQRDVIAGLKARGLWESEHREVPLNIVATYDYTDRRGELLYQVVRLEPKDFLQRRPDGHGDWVWKKHSRQVLYRLPEVIEAPIVFVVEGEKDAETLRKHGFVATTNAGGANATWLPQYTDTLRGREVILIPDADRPGRQRVLAIARALLGQAACVIVWEPDDSKDVTQWFERGHSEVELIAQVEGQAVNDEV